MLDWSFRKALVARKAAFRSRMFMWLSASKGDQRPFAVEPLQHAPQPALDASDIMYKSGAGGGGVDWTPIYSYHIPLPPL